MQDYTVTADTDFENFVRECTILVDGNKIYRFSKELLAYIEMCVAFSQHYRQNDPHTASAMDMYLRDALKKYADIAYNDLHVESTTTWRDDFMLGTRSSSHQAQPSSVLETLSWVQWCKLKALTELRHLLRKPGTA